MAVRLIAFVAMMLTIVFGAAPHADAGTPELHRIRPVGAQRGVDVDMTFAGRRLGDAVDLMFYRPGITLKAIADAKDNRIVATLTVAPDCPLGEHVIRVRTATGVSDARTIRIGPFPVVDEAEPNDEFTSPQLVDRNVTVHGVVKNEDVDYYAVDVEAGQRVSVEIEAIRLGETMFDAYVAILDERRFELATSDDTALLLQDAAATIIAPSTGRYVIQVRESSYGGGDNNHYRLHIGSFPRPTAATPAGGAVDVETTVSAVGDPAGPIETRITPTKLGLTEVYAVSDGVTSPSPVWFMAGETAGMTEVEPNNNRNQATPTTDLTLPALHGVIESAGDEDWFAFDAKKGNQIDVRVHARLLRSPLDAVVHVFEPSGKYIGGNDDAGGPDSVYRFNPPADGTYTLRVRDHLNAGGIDYVYSVELDPVDASLSLTVPEVNRNKQDLQSVATPRGNRFAVVMSVNRTGFRGDVSIDTTALPAGMTMHAPTIPASIDRVPVVFEATDEAPLAGALLPVMARRIGDGPTIEGQLNIPVKLVLGRPNQTVYYGTQLDRLAVSVTEPAPFSIELIQPAAPLVQGGRMDLRVRVKRDEGFDGEVTLRLPWLPPGVGGAREVKAGKGVDEVQFPINASGNAGLGDWPIVATGFAGTKSGEIGVATQLATLAVQPPFVTMTVGMTAAQREGHVALIGQLTFATAFEGEAIATLRGLPRDVRLVEPAHFKHGDAAVTFDVEVGKDAPIGRHGALYCEVTLTHLGEPVVHQIGHDAELRVDPPPPAPVKPVAAAPAPPPKPEPAKVESPPQAKPLSRLEQLRVDAERRRNESSNAGGDM